MVQAYRLVRSNRKSLCLKLLPDGSVELRAPRLLPKLIIDLWFQSKQAWLHRAKARLRERSVPAELAIEPGSLQPYLGQWIQLLPASGYQFDAQTQQLQLPLSEQPEFNQKSLRHWYRQQALEVIEAVWQQLQPQALARGLVAQGIKYRWMKRRWGSCSRDGWITLNLELIKYPLPCIELVLIHELCHLRHFDHGPQFKALLADWMPSHQQWQQRLESGCRAQAGSDL